MKRLIALMLALCMVFSIAACSSTTTEPTAAPVTEAPAADNGETEAPAVVETNDGEFVINACIASEPETIDPSMISAVDASIYTNHQFEGLMKYSNIDETVDESGRIFNTELVGGMAESYDVNEDATVYTFHLRDAKWSDGQAVTANDFVYSWQRLVNPDNACEYGYFLNGIVVNAAAIQAGEKDASELGIVALDEKTVEITLEAPCAYFVSMCAFPCLVPLREDVVEGNADWTNPENIVVNGGYKAVEWVHDSYIRMEPNAEYYDVENLGPDAIVWWLSDSETAILSAYQSGEYQFIENFPTDMIETLQASGDCVIDPYIGTYYLYLNCTKITDWRVRAAMALSVDRENLVENVTQGGQRPATGLVAQGIMDSTGKDFSETDGVGALYDGLQAMYPDYDLGTYAGRCELAKALYDEAVADGAWDANTTVVYNYNTSETHKAIAEAAGSDWQSVLGMNITLENQEWATYTNGLGEHAFGVARLGWIADFNDALTYLELMTTGNSYNYGVYENAKFDELCKAAKATNAGAERDEMMYNAEKELFTEGGFPVAPLYFYTQVACLDQSIDNVGFTSLGYYFFNYATQN